MANDNKPGHWWVRLQERLPARALGKFVYWLSRIEFGPVKNLLIRVFVWLYVVDTSEAAKRVPSGYRSFNDFFTRELKAGHRPIDTTPDSLVSPADGKIAESGHIAAGRLLQAKGVDYSAADLLADSELAARLDGHAFCTIYLAPHNYHRIHLPLEGSLQTTAFVPGQLYSVDNVTTRTVPGLYVRNERLVCHFAGPEGEFALVLVGAINVASISTAWDGELQPPADGRIVRRDYRGQSTDHGFRRGAYVGHFNLGSTVVLIAPARDYEWLDAARPGENVRVGAILARRSAQA